MEDVETPGRDDDRRARRPSSASPKSKTAKAAFFVTGDGRFVVAIVRGDYDVNETKLVNAVKARRRPPAGDGRGDQGARAWRPATARRSARATRSSSSTSSSRGRRTSSPARTGSAGTCRTSTSPRDYTPDYVAEITNAREGDPCPTCGSPVKPPQRASRSATSSSSGPNSPTPFGVDVPRRGRRARTRSSWARTGSGSGGTSPASSRPTTTRRASSGRTRSRRTPRTSSSIGADRDPHVARDRRAAPRARRRTPGREILYDDRDESPGVKFTDAELLGMPWILTVVAALARRGRRRGHAARDRRAGDARRSRTSRRCS